MHDAENNAESAASMLAMYRLREPRQWSELIRRRLDIAWHAAQGWVDYRCDSQAAAMAFYALFSLAPMLVLVVAIGGYVLDASVVSERIFVELRRQNCRTGVVRRLSPPSSSCWSARPLRSLN